MTPLLDQNHRLDVLLLKEELQFVKNVMGLAV